MLTKLAALALAVPTAGAAALFSADYVIVDVHERGPNGIHLTVPVPITLAQAALAVAPEDARRLELPPEAVEHAGAARRFVEELRRQPDFELVRVEEADERVLVRKQGDELRVDVEGGRGETVHVRLPLTAAAELLGRLDGRRVRTALLLDALRHAKGEIVHVADADTEVRVRVW